MDIRINSKLHTIPDQMTLAELLGSLGLEQANLVVELNGEILTGKTDFTTCLLHAGDKLEILRLVGGG